MDAGLVQIIVALIGASSPIILQILQQGKQQTSNATTSQASSTATPSVNEATISGAYESRSYLDLSIILLYATFFSAILTDSLLVSGRIPTLGISVILEIFVITLFTTLSLLFAWYWCKSETAIGILSVTTLIVLLLSPGGSISTVKQGGEGEVGLSLLLPVFVLILLATSSAIYLFGNPLSKNTLPRMRRKVILLLSVLFAIGTLTLGQQFVTQVSDNPLSPKKFTGSAEQVKQSEDVLSAIRTKSLAERGLLYRLGSEVALSQYYLESYFQVLSSFDFSNINRITNPTKSNKSIGLDSQASRNNQSNPQSATSNQSSREDNSSSRRVVSYTQERDRINTLEAIAAYFRSNPSSQLSYLADRILWIHPSVTEGNNQLNFPLPGTSAKDRFASLSNYRIFYAMSTQQNLLDKFFNLFTYDSEIVDAFRRPSKDERDRQVLLSDQYRDTFRDESKFSELPRDTLSKLFPDLPAQSYYKNLLLQQLAFPEPDELFVAYSTYADLAPSFEVKQVQQAKRRFDRLRSETQRAFISYIANTNSGLDNYEVFAELAKRSSKKTFPDLGNSLSSSLELANQIQQNSLTALDENVSTPGVKEAAKLISEIFKNDPNSKQKLAEILRGEKPEIRLNNLFKQEAFDFIVGIDSDLTDEQKKTFLALLSEPVIPVIRQIVKNLAPYRDADWLSKQLESFIALTPSNREAILHNLAVAIYRAEGNNSLDPISLLVFQAQSLSYWLAFLCSIILMLPVVSAAILSGIFLGRKLIERDRTRGLIIAEKANGGEFSDVHTLGIPVDIQARPKLLERLRKLSERGWSTIAVVGRRGVGKSRILYELYKPTLEEEKTFGVSVWLSAPSQYAEKDFIETALEQLALNTEQSVARFLGAEPFSVRRLEALLTRSGLLLFAIVTLALTSLLLTIYLRLQRPEVIITWFPILLVFVASVACFIRHTTRLQPVNLAPWLESDRMYSPHTVLLYRRVQEAFRYIRYQKFAAKVGSDSILSKIVAGNIAGIVIGVCILFAVSFIVSASVYSPTGIIGVFLLLTSLSFIIVSFYRLSGKKQNIERGESLMSLISEYRSFATAVVYRLNQGALGNTGKNVMVCIDELDKIVELDELKVFLRRMKAIFEVPGVYYYLSLSEDALKSLYLGSAEGKNEIDSSLDHIVRVPPLSWDESEKLAEAYLERRQVLNLEPKVLEVLITISFGVPRDILRRLDEFLAKEDSSGSSPNQLIAEVRRDQVEIASEAYQWSRSFSEALLDEAMQSAVFARKTIGEMLKSESPKFRDFRAIALIWILCCVEVSNGLEDSKSQAFLKALHDLGYRLTLMPLPDLLDEIDILSSTFLP
ncbi:NB-ARC domain-containing protein [Leptolyngbya sp. AN10]|uniref:NB-ARC domain-containing protein n=1 Tax=Leptolyngbya sp. AN10 TaxID=3423365 RepID=UPI003D322847